MITEFEGGSEDKKDAVSWLTLMTTTAFAKMNNNGKTHQFSHSNYVRLQPREVL